MGNPEKTLTPATSKLAPTIKKFMKFSDFLTSPVFSVIVGKENQETFLLHSELLADESDRLAKDVKGGFGEQKSNSILLDEEDPELFGHFVEYMYHREWPAKQETLRATDYCVIARLYALGERLQAHKFQCAALRKFTLSFPPQPPLSEQDVCDLLEIACAELPDRINEDPLRAQIFWHGATRLAQLRTYDYFPRLLEIHKDLGRHLCIWVGRKQPTKPSES